MRTDPLDRVWLVACDCVCIAWIVYCGVTRHQWSLFVTAAILSAWVVAWWLTSQQGALRTQHVVSAIAACLVCCVPAAVYLIDRQELDPAIAQLAYVAPLFMIAVPYVFLQGADAASK